MTDPHREDVPDDPVEPGPSQAPQYNVNNKVGHSTGPTIQSGSIGQVHIHQNTGPADGLDVAGKLLAQAVRSQWRAEERWRRVQDPGPLPLRWRVAPGLADRRTTTSHPQEALGSPEPARIVTEYQQVQTGRLVVLGRAGSGKSVLAIRFVLDLLGAPDTPVRAVPVVFGLGSWNPATPLRDWLAGQLQRDHPGLAAAAPCGTSTLAAALLDDDRILPVLDGFDEIAPRLRHSALQALNDSTPMPLLLTSRAKEFAAAVKATGRVLTGAAAVELTDLSPADLAKYLPHTTIRTTSDNETNVWTPVLERLHGRHPSAQVLKDVLTTPLMVSLARAVYSDCPDRDPSALLVTERFRTARDIEHHLLDSYVPTLYRDLSAERLKRVLHWLGYLAHHLDQLHTPNLHWWQLGASLPRLRRTVVIGLVAGVAFGAADGLMWCTYAVAMLGYPLTVGLAIALPNGLAFGAAGGAFLGAVYALAQGGRGRRPSHVRVRLRGGTRAIGRHVVNRFLTGFAAVLGVACTAWILIALITAIVLQSPHAFLASLTLRLPFALLTGVTCGLPAGLGYGLLAALEAPIDIKTAVSPPRLLRTDRTNVLFQAAVLILTLTAADGILYGTGVYHFTDWFAVEIVGGLGGVLAYALGLTAWGQWIALARIWLPLTGQLPWRVEEFLKDAHQRGILRQAGAVYQFRHARLHDHLSQSYRSANHRSQSVLRE
ncbi:NACHT domain-containing protein [Streptomyces noursei]|uniref:NACHT domain-containing protein n=1 Tax=Streptomyces noursei TaxID=1971 RepID=UPI003801698B